MIILIISKYMHTIQHNKTKMTGFLLIELMISLLLLIITIILIGSFHNIVISNQHDTIKRWLAVNTLHSFIAQAKTNPTLLKKNKVEINNAIISWQLNDYSLEGLTQPLFAHTLVKNMHYTIEWKGFQDKKYHFHGSTGI